MEKSKEEQWSFIRYCTKSFIKSVKPWKTSLGSAPEEYRKGWNDCIKELNKNEQRFFAHMDKKFNEEDTAKT